MIINNLDIKMVYYLLNCRVQKSSYENMFTLLPISTDNKYKY